MPSNNQPLATPCANPHSVVPDAGKRLKKTGVEWEIAELGLKTDLMGQPQIFLSKWEKDIKMQVNFFLDWAPPDEPNPVSFQFGSTRRMTMKVK